MKLKPFILLGVLLMLVFPMGTASADACSEEKCDKKACCDSSNGKHIVKHCVKNIDIKKDKKCCDLKDCCDLKGLFKKIKAMIKDHFGNDDDNLMLICTSCDPDESGENSIIKILKLNEDGTIKLDDFELPEELKSVCSDGSICLEKGIKNGSGSIFITPGDGTDIKSIHKFFDTDDECILKKLHVSKDGKCEIKDLESGEVCITDDGFVKIIVEGSDDDTIQIYKDGDFVTKTRPNELSKQIYLKKFYGLDNDDLDLDDLTDLEELKELKELDLDALKSLKNIDCLVEDDLVKVFVKGSEGGRTYKIFTDDESESEDKDISRRLLLKKFTKMDDEESDFDWKSFEDFDFEIDEDTVEVKVKSSDDGHVITIRIVTDSEIDIKSGKSLKDLLKKVMNMLDDHEIDKEDSDSTGDLKAFTELNQLASLLPSTPVNESFSANSYAFFPDSVSDSTKSSLESVFKNLKPLSELSFKLPVINLLDDFKACISDDCCKITSHKGNGNGDSSNGYSKSSKDKEPSKIKSFIKGIKNFFHEVRVMKAKLENFNLVDWLLGRNDTNDYHLNLKELENGNNSIILSYDGKSLPSFSTLVEKPENGRLILESLEGSIELDVDETLDDGTYRVVVRNRENDEKLFTMIIEGDLDPFCLNPEDSVTDEKSDENNDLTEDEIKTEDQTQGIPDTP